MTDAIPDEILREAMLVAVDMEIHAALSTTTRAKAEVIAKALMARDKRTAEIARGHPGIHYIEGRFHKWRLATQYEIAQAILTYEASNAK